MTLGRAPGWRALIAPWEIDPLYDPYVLTDLVVTMRLDDDGFQITVTGAGIDIDQTGTWHPGYGLADLLALGGGLLHIHAVVEREGQEAIFDRVTLTR